MLEAKGPIVKVHGKALALSATLLIAASVGVTIEAQEDMTLGGQRIEKEDESIEVVGERIVGGEPTDIKEHPWQVAIHIKRQGRLFLCSGSLIEQRWVLTAAHCFDKSTQPGDVTAKAGVTDYVAKGTWAGIDKLVVHAEYDPATHKNDIALIRFKGNPKGDITPSSIRRLDAGEVLKADQLLEVTGWGKTETGQGSNQLRKAKVPYVENETCNDPGSYNGTILRGMLCAGYRDGGIDACLGDSGGPLVWVKPNKVPPALVGIVSFGAGCAQKAKYGVYTRVTAYGDWVAQAIAAGQK
jgi:secreted trypsin-like serine protease